MCLSYWNKLEFLLLLFNITLILWHIIKDMGFNTRKAFRRDFLNVINEKQFLKIGEAVAQRSSNQTCFHLAICIARYLLVCRLLLQCRG